MHEYQSPEDMTWWFWPKAHPGVFLTESMPTVSNEHIVGPGSNSAHSCAELFTLFVGIIGAFCRENPTGRGLLDEIQENH